MLRNKSITNKFFLGFFLTSVIAVLTMMFIIYFSIKSSMVDSKIKQIEVLHHIKYKQIQDSINRLQDPFLKFIKSNSELYGFSTLLNQYKGLSDNFSKAEVLQCRQELLKHYTGKMTKEPVLDYMHISVQDGIPQNSNGIIAQCIKLKNRVDILSLQKMNFDSQEIIEYEKQYRKSQKALQVSLHLDAFESVLFISADDEIFFSSDRNSVLGHNVISSSWIKGLSTQISKFHTMTSAGQQEYFFIDMQPFVALNGYPVFFIAAPIFEHKKYKGSVVLVVPSLYLDGILSNNNSWEKSGYGKTGDAYLTSELGIFRSNKRQFIENRDEYLLLAKTLKRPAITYDMVERFNTLAYYSSVLKTTNVSSYAGKSDYEISKTLDNKEVLTYYTPINIGNLSWILFVRMDMSEVTSELDQIRTLMRNMIIPLFIILLCVAYLLAHLTTSPIRRMQKSCRLISQGNYSSSKLKGGYKEINELISSFESMVKTIVENERHTYHVKKELEESIFNQAVISQELKEERDFIGHILDSKGFFIFIIDENDKIIRTNSIMPKIYPDRKIIGEKYENFLPVEYRRRVAYIMSLLREGNENIPHFISSNMFNNKAVYVEWNFSTFTGRDLKDGHQALFITAIGVNITERYEAEQHSQENIAMFHKIFSNAYDAVLIADENNDVLLVNKSFEQLFEVDYVELVGKPVVPNIFSQEYKNVVLSDTQEGKTIEIEAIKHDKTRFPVDLSISKIIYKGKLSILYILRDSSNRKQKENELHTALTRAKDAERTKSEFLANMSHEIRTPLNGIIGFIDLLKDTQLNKAQKEYVKIISASSENLFSIMDDILDFSKIESGSMQLENIDFNAWNVFEDSASIYAARAMDKNILLFCFFSVEMPKYLVGDPLRIRQIITNLLSNAIKFTDEGGRVILRVSIISQNDDSCRVRISVKDTGIGISKDQQNIIMNAYAQADVSISRKYGGSGLGLAISQSLTSAMNSKLNLYSEYGEGSEFYFTLDLPVAHKEEQRSKKDCSDVKILLFDCNKDCSHKELYEEYFKNIKTKVKYSYDKNDLLDDTNNIIAINCDHNDYDFISSIINEYHNKTYILFTISPHSNKVMSLKGNNIFHVTPPFTITKLMDTLAAIKGENKIITTKNKKLKHHTFTGNVLLVDDNDVNLKLAEMLLTNMGLNVDSVENGQLALEKYMQNKYDIIFMDIYMPLMDGMEATREIIKYEKEHNMFHTPIVALTANEIKEDIESYHSVGMDDFIAKPIVKSKLESVLGRYLFEEEPSIKNEIINGVSSYLQTDNTEEIYNVINDYCNSAWHYIQNLTGAVRELNEGSSYYIIEKLITMSSNFSFHRTVDILEKIKSNLDSGINDDIYPLIDDLKDAVYKIKRSTR